MAVKLNRRAYEHAFNDGRFVFDERDVWMGAVAWGLWPRPVSHPSSSNRTSRFPASGFPTGFTARHTETN